MIFLRIESELPRNICFTEIAEKKDKILRNLPA